MRKIPRGKTNVYEIDAPLERLIEIAFMIRGLSYLLESKRTDDQPIDVEDLFYGIALVFNALGREVAQIASLLEEAELK